MTDDSVETGQQRGTARGLDRETVVQAALRSIDRSGAQGLTMRGLGQELGVRAMSLYRYVSGREDVLEAVVTLLLEGLPGRLDQRLSRTWQGYLQALAHTIREIALQHPRAFPLVATRHPAAPWLRPPLRSLEVVEDFLATLGRFGFTDDQMVDTYRSFSSFLLGHLLLESAIHGAETSPVEEPLDEGDAQVPNQDGRIDLSSATEVVRLQTRLSEDRGTEEFEASLESLLDRIELQISQ
ncbi:MAG TPA: TetR/AcrR family transcriptional regulator C-terminal domain-containing protein [Microlunatus sp.]|nr:TetR/AcrR family transcriptional regulator C-terminal domain-containing protein [Microlunatus sp.]